MDCWRQWIRHRTANVNEYSTRYSIAMEGTQTTPPAGWRLQAKNNRQGSEGTIDRVLGKKLSDEEKELHSLTRKVYNKRIEAGIAREQARKDLPLSTYTEAYWKIDLGNLLHFLALRMEKNAQYEIRSYAEIIGNEIVSRWCPLVWEAFRDYTMNNVCFSSHEQKILQALLKGNKPQAVKIARNLEWLREKEGTLVRHYEREEFEDKLKQMKISAPWE